jgi:hypothetical protein
VRVLLGTDPADFLAVAGGYLAAEPVVNTVVTTVAHRMLSRRHDGLPQPDRDWWLVVSDDSGSVVGAGMRTATVAPYPPFLLPMPDEAAVAVAHTLHERGEQVTAVNGALPAVERCAAELARLDAGRVEVGQRTRLHELGELRMPARVPGAMVAVAEDDVGLAMEWLGTFAADADEQAGRPRGAGGHEVPDRAEALRRIRSGQLWFWVDDTGTPVHLTATNPPSFGVARVGPVYTPPGQRGRGWASNAVAEASRRMLADGARVCLFTDQANPTTSRVYAALGYRPVADMADLRIVCDAGSTRSARGGALPY